MAINNWIQKELFKTIKVLEKDIKQSDRSGKMSGINLSHRNKILGALDKLLAVLFPGVLGDIDLQEKNLKLFLSENLSELIAVLHEQINHFLEYEQRQKGMPHTNVGGRAKRAVKQLIENLPRIRKELQQDIEAAYEGDPAAVSRGEVLVSYPCVEAIATYRIAHQLYQSKIPIIPRIMSERAHSRTGVDIHPGATIGSSFFIDHGTGVVIGETTVIGKNVKLYQGVTLGALSFPKDEQGNPIKGIKRHPNIKDGVIIYAGATVLGGDTTIGKNSVIGGNCWLTSSVPANTSVSMEAVRTKIKKRNQG